MIYERLTLIIVFSTLSLASQSSSATELSTVNSSLTTSIALSDGDSNQNNGVAPKYSQENFYSTNDLNSSLIKSLKDARLAQNRIKAQSPVHLAEPKAQSHAAVKSDNSPEQEEFAAKINRGWFIATMGLTSAISLVLIRILFRKPAEKIVATPKNSQAIDIDLVPKLIQDLQQNKQLQEDDLTKPLSVREEQDNLRRKAICELGRIGDYRSIQPLAEVMSQADSLDKRLISESIAQITNRSYESINDELFALLQDENPEVRKNAIQDLAALYKFVSPIAKRLTKMQSDTDYEVRETAKKALHQLNFSSFSSTLNSYSGNGSNNLAPKEQGKTNIHLLAYLLEESNTDQ